MAGRRQRGRPVSGILLLDKPRGMTSNEALQRVKRLYRAQKAGHTGSLDPLATGLLPICLGEATKVSGFLLSADKEYRAVCRLGVRTSSGDADGEVLETRPVPPLDPARVEAVLARFRGEIRQVPPMHSAIKRGGVPLYKLAHAGQEVPREARTVTIHRLELESLRENELVLHVRCSKGTYIRTLAEDIGEALGCGAHIVALERIGVGPFDARDMVPLARLEALAAEEGVAALDRLLLPVDAALRGWPRVDLTETAAYYLRKGQPVFVPGVGVSGWVRLYGPEGAFLGMGTVLDDGRVAPKRLVNPFK